MGEHLIVKNKKAYFNYEIIETFEAGLVLNGPEIKSIRSKDVSINESFVLIRRGRAEILNMSIKKYEFATNIKLEPERNRFLLLHKKEQEKILKRIKLENLTLIPLRLYLKDNLAKIELGLGKGKKNYDKRETIKQRDVERRIAKINKN
ncbi:SsrA-binding protein SmpB [Spiroplasma endosymbiont of Panorpa germanica]|uniref:SsrA-binding protein SmpB n=1 Tax=Spiroplasma endosymbiont of Panorpa germanica TaxID=3066314 RepID=UPI0030D00942